MKPSCCCLAVVLAVSLSWGGALAAATLPVQEETLGPWHYLLPLVPITQANYSRPMFAPTAVEFGDKRIAVILPGSESVAEFQTGVFEELSLPRFESPLSLAVDRQGKLYALLQRTDHIRRKNGWRERWIVSWTHCVGWSQPIQVPFPDADRVEFDRQNRLWALGPAATVAVYDGGRWNHYRYSNDAHLDFATMRLADGENGDTLLFSHWREDQGRHPSHLPGALVYRGGKFIAEPQRDVTGLRQEQQHKDDALASDDFARSRGYICHVQALNTRRAGEGATTVLRTDAYVLVSLNNEGLVWASTAALRSAPLMDENAEWERFDDVVVPPTIAPDGAMWLVRDHPRRLIKITKSGQEEFPIAGSLPLDPESSVIDLDQLGRPWLLGRNAQAEAACLKDGVVKMYASLFEALLAESAAFQPGQVFPRNDLTVKNPGGAFCLLDYETFTICDGQSVQAFTDEAISPGHTKRIVMPRHGYNPFREGRPRFDAEGNIFTAVDGLPFRFQHGQWREVELSAKRQTLLQPPASAPEPGDALSEDETRLRAVDGRSRVFRRLHFYGQTADGHWESLDHGLNPLAYYPFWSGWYESPGMSTPQVDPTGRIWISPLGPYAQNRVWMRLREAH